MRRHLNGQVFGIVPLVTILFAHLLVAQESFYTAIPVAGGSPEVIAHFEQFGFPSLRTESWRTHLASPPEAAVASPGYQMASHLRPPSALEGLPKQAVKPKAAGAASGLFGSADYLNFHLIRRDLDYAISSLPGAIVITGGEIHELEHDTTPACRAMIGYQWANGWQLGLGYTTFQTTAFGSAEDGSGTLYATRSHPDLNRRAAQADASSGLKMSVFDLEARNSIHLGKRASLTLLGSFRWADFGQEFDVTYSGIDFPASGTVTSLTDNHAFGLRIGADARWDATDRLYLLGGAETSILYSDTSISLTETNGPATILSITDSYKQVLPVLGARVGGGGQYGKLNVELGYEMQTWFDLGDRMSFLDDQHLGVFSHSNHTVLMHGFYLRVGWQR
jgi:hypothetical protein